MPRKEGAQEGDRPLCPLEMDSACLKRRGLGTEWSVPWVFARHFLVACGCFAVLFGFVGSLVYPGFVHVGFELAF